MAIEIIPKQKTKEVSWANIVLYVVLVLLLAFVLSYIFFVFYQQRLQREFRELETALQRTPSEKDLEETVLLLKNRIDDSGMLLAQHRLPTRVFDLLEQNTHPRVWFFDVKLNFAIGSLDISGVASNFEVLGQQILIFEQNQSIKQVKVSRVSVGREGDIRFSLQLVFDKNLLK